MEKLSSACKKGERGHAVPELMAMSLSLAGPWNQSMVTAC